MNSSGNVIGNSSFGLLYGCVDMLPGAIMLPLDQIFELSSSRCVLGDETLYIVRLPLEILAVLNVVGVLASAMHDRVRLPPYMYR